MLQIYNSLSRKKEIFEPRQPGKVGLYVCGMTVYDYCHLGHARVLVVFDMVVRYLRWLGLEVNYVRNITDIDDKIIERANQRKLGYEVLTKTFIDEMHADSEKLFIIAPNQEPRATGYITEIIDMVQRLIDNGLAYVGNNGDVYYSVREFDHYGQLSGKNLDDLRAGARVETDQEKRDPLDFVLWKAAKPDEPYWSSPWG